MVKMLKYLLGLILLSLAIMVAGCLEEDELTTTPVETMTMSEQAPTASPTASPIITPTVTSTLAAATPTPTAIKTTAESKGASSTPLPQYEFGVEYKAQVIGVIDGDTVDVFVYPDNREERVRLLGIDAPESVAVRNIPGEYDNITDTHCLETWGQAAKQHLQSAIAGRICEIEFDQQAGYRDQYGRLLAYVDYNKDINAEMVKLGLARVYVEENFTRESEYLKFQVEAKEEVMGLWNCKD